MKRVPNSCITGYRVKRLVLPLLVCFFYVGPAMAAEALLPIRATIVNCGSQTERAARCQKDERCCNLGDSSEDADHQDARDEQKTGNRSTAQVQIKK